MLPSGRLGVRKGSFLNQIEIRKRPLHPRVGCDAQGMRGGREGNRSKKLREKRLK